MTSNNFLPDSINENFVELRLPFVYLQLLRKLEKYVTNSSYHLYWLQQLQLRWNHFPATFLLLEARAARSFVFGHYLKAGSMCHKTDIAFRKIP